MNNTRQSGISPKKNKKSAQPTLDNVTTKQTSTKGKNTGITALYERLSREDGEDGISNSITNQKALLEDYAKKNGFTNIRHFSDDGWSGTNFDRPAWKELYCRS